MEGGVQGLGGRVDGGPALEQQAHRVHVLVQHRHVQRGVSLTGDGPGKMGLVLVAVVVADGWVGVAVAVMVVVAVAAAAAAAAVAVMVLVVAVDGGEVPNGGGLLALSIVGTNATLL